MGGTYGGVDNPWYASPAAFPLLIGSLLFLLGFTVVLTGVRAAAHRGLKGAAMRAVRSLGRRPARQGLIAVLLLFAYYLLIQSHWIPGPSAANYIISSVLFLAGFALCFYRPRHRFPSIPVVLALVAGAILISWGVAALFSGPLHVPLP